MDIIRNLNINYFSQFIAHSFLFPHIRLHNYKRICVGNIWDNATAAE